jgi:HD superfamily phosphohydrolase YqeK
VNEEQIFSEIRAALPALVGQEKRMRHILGVEQEAKALSELFCEAGLLQKGEAKKLRLAALVHDITKTKTTEEQLQLCREYGIATDARLQNSSKLLESANETASPSRKSCASLKHLK